MQIRTGINIRDYINEKKNELLLGRLTTREFMKFFGENMQKIDTLFTYSECAMMEVETKLRVLNEEFMLTYDHSPIETIKTRLKTLESLIEKINRYEVPLTMESIYENINDIAGVRVICSFQNDIYALADCLLEQDDITLIESKDYIRSPKSNGYRSLHLIISVPIFLEHEKRDMKVEVQLRTIAMDFWASLEHKIRYKKDLPDELAESLYDELLECAILSTDLDKRMQNIRNQLDQVHSDGPAHIIGPSDLD
ncbi:MAG: GTP pyrophosphokinase family protein [Firmicutes bacterium]|nr:GTP pyrophosphokinase family protein [Bacillota bacterium]